MPTKASSKKAPTNVNWNIVLLVVGFLAALYVFGLKENMAVKGCHTKAEEIARARLDERVKLNPDNKTLLQAAKANLYAQEDYQPAYKACLINKGYDK